MKKDILLKLLIIIVSIIIIIILTIILLLNGKQKNYNANTDANTNTNTNTNTKLNITSTPISNVDNIDISEKWYRLNDLDYYKTVMSFEKYIQKDFEKTKKISNFSGFNINDIWCYNTIQNGQITEEYYINGYIYNLNFSSFKEIGLKFILYENSSFKIEYIDLLNTSWDSIINNKTTEIKSNWNELKKQFDFEEKVEENSTEDDDEESIAIDGDEEASMESIEQKPQYNENEFVILDISDKDLINKYFINFKIKALFNKQEAYNLLHKETQNSLFKTLQDFENGISKYLNNNTEINKIKIVNSITDKTGSINKCAQYIIADGNGNMFGIEITGIKNYTVAITTE